NYNKHPIISASNGSAEPESESGLSLATGGGNGKISYTADTDNAGQHVKIVYPDMQSARYPRYFSVMLKYYCATNRLKA
ncbi:hypothetical protein, partial [Desulfobacter sp.]|uniref:hypothetical protein n=1 Tax=Desulfobacter sp. TaxID=2294 RepID=UPI00257F82BB